MPKLRPLQPIPDYVSMGGPGALQRYLEMDENIRRAHVWEGTKSHRTPEGLAKKAGDQLFRLIVLNHIPSEYKHLSFEQVLIELVKQGAELNKIMQGSKTLLDYVVCGQDPLAYKICKVVTLLRHNATFVKDGSGSPTNFVLREQHPALKKLLEADPRNADSVFSTSICFTPPFFGDPLYRAFFTDHSKDPNFHFYSYIDSLVAAGYSLDQVQSNGGILWNLIISPKSNISYDDVVFKASTLLAHTTLSRQEKISALHLIDHLQRSGKISDSRARCLTEIQEMIETSTIQHQLYHALHYSFDGVPTSISYDQYIDRLFKQGADVNHIYPNGETATHSMVRCGSQGRLSILLDYLPNLLQKNNVGETPLALAKRLFAESKNDQYERIAHMLERITQQQLEVNLKERAEALSHTPKLLCNPQSDNEGGDSDDLADRELQQLTGLSMQNSKSKEKQSLVVPARPRTPHPSVAVEPPRPTLTLQG